MLEELVIIVWLSLTTGATGRGETCLPKLHAISYMQDAAAQHPHLQADTVLANAGQD